MDGIDFALMAGPCLSICIICVGVGITPGSSVSASPISLGAANISGGQYLYTDDLLKLEECTNKDSCRILWPACPLLIHIANWREFVRSHPDSRFASYIYSALSMGFCIGFDRQVTSL